MNNFLTNTGVTHKNNPNRTSTTPTTVSTTVVTTPIDPTDKIPSQDFPTEKLHLLRECFTKYTAFAQGDILESGGVEYVVRAVHPWDGGTYLDDFYHLILERKIVT